MSALRMQITLTSLCLILAIFCFVVIAGHVAAGGGRDGNAARLLLAAFILSLAMSLINFLLVASNAVFRAPSLAFLGNTIGLSAAPLLYLYARSLAEREFRFRGATLWHFLPVFVFLAVVVRGYTLKPRAEQLRILADPAYPGDINAPLLQAAIFAFVFLCLFGTIRVLFRHRTRFADFYASGGPAELSWLRISVFGAMSVWTGSLAHQIIVAIWPVPWLDAAFMNILALSAFVFGFYFLINALRQTSRRPLPIPAPEGAREKYGEHRLSGGQIREFAAIIETHLAETKMHLRNTLSLDELADALPMTARELSQTLNRHFGKTFFEFINEHRIRHAMMRIRTDREASITEVMTESGFASKSSFYAAFRAVAGVTPTAYRRQEMAGPDGTASINTASSV